MNSFMSNSKQIRVCQVLHGIVGGGSEQVVLNYCSRMRDIHFDLLFQYDPNPQILERFNEAGINCIQIPDKVHHPFKHLWTMFKMFRKGHYDVVHTHLDWYMNCYVCFLAMLAGIKKRIAHHHQAYLKWGLLCALFRIPCKLFATHWLACGEAAAINGWGKNALKKGKVTILPNAIDPERFKFSEKSRQEIRAKYGIKEDDFVIGHVGRFFPEKNHRFLLKVFSKFHQGHPQSRLLLLGVGPLLDEMVAFAKKLNLADSVIFAGLQKNPAPFYNAMDVFCFPSRREALGLVLVEAQCSNLPCIVSQAVPEESKVSDVFCRIKSYELNDWLESLEKFYSCSFERKSIVPESFDISHLYKMLEAFYTKE